MRKSACGVDMYLDQQSIDTTTPAGKLMFQVTGAFAEFERSMIRQRVNTGLKRAVEQGKTLGRPKVSDAIERRIRKHLKAGTGILTTARLCGVGSVHRHADPRPGVPAFEEVEDDVKKAWLGEQKERACEKA